MARRSQSRTLTDPEEIRQWAEEREAQPACVRGTGGTDDVGMLRLDFPGYSGEQSLEHIGWDEWLEKFEENNLALLVQDTTAGGERSNFNKIVSRATAEAGSRSRSRWRSRRGQTEKSDRAGRRTKSQARARKARGGTKSTRARNRRQRTSSGRQSTRRSRSSGGRKAAARAGGRSQHQSRRAA